MSRLEGQNSCYEADSTALRPINEKEPKFISICNRGEFLVESKESKQRFVLLVKKKVT